MAKEKKIKVKKKIDWKHEMALAPGYIIVILWVAFTFMLLGWIIAASLSTTTDIFAGKALKFPSGLHFVCDGYSNHDDRSSIVWSCSKSGNSE